MPSMQPVTMRWWQDWWRRKGKGSKILTHTREVYPGLIVTGMAANAVSGEHRMGPVFGGMLLSGEKAAAMVLEQLRP